MGHIERYRYCKRCEEFFELTDSQVELKDVAHYCGGESSDGTDGPEHDYVIYDRENPR